MRTAAAQLEFTVHLPRLDAGPFTCAVWTPAHELRIQAPPSLREAASGPLNARASVSSPHAGRVYADPLARAFGGGRGVPPHAKPSCLGMTTATATGFALPAVFARLPPASLRPPGGGAS